MRYYASIIAGLALILGGTLVVHAQTYTPLAPLPIGEGGATPETYTLTTYLSGMIKLLIAVAGALAVLMTIIGGAKYVAAGINPSAKSDARGDITNALIGLTLVLTSYLLLRSIDPRLVEFNLALPPVGQMPAAPGVVTATPTQAAGPCPAPLTPLSGDALSMENGASVLFTSSNSNVNRNLTKLQTEVNRLRAVLQTVGGSMTVNSAYRPLSYQQHLWEIWDRWKTQGLENNVNPDCAALKTQVGNEYRRHGLGSLVARPSGCAPHVKGTGADIRVSGYSYDRINTLMQSKGIDLRWQGIPGDEVHFNLQNPPFSGCVQ